MAQIIIIENKTATESHAFKMLAQLTAVPVYTVEMWRLRANELADRAKLIDLWIEQNPTGIILVLT